MAQAQADQAICRILAGLAPKPRVPLLSRRKSFCKAAAGLASRAQAPSPRAEGRSGVLTGGAQAADPAERAASSASKRLRPLMAQRKVAGELVESGSSLEYFTANPLAPIEERRTWRSSPIYGEVTRRDPAFEEAFRFARPCR